MGFFNDLVCSIVSGEVLIVGCSSVQIGGEKQNCHCILGKNAHLGIDSKKIKVQAPPYVQAPPSLFSIQRRPCLLPNTHLERQLLSPQLICSATASFLRSAIIFWPEIQLSKLW